MLSLGRQFVFDCVPPIAWELYRRFIKRSGYFGNYSEWEQARQDSTGYDSDVILERVRDAVLRVKNGEAVYERDSVLFDEAHYSWPLLAGLLWIASCNGGRLNLLDFGGSLGSSYFQNRKLLRHLSEFSWSVVEQETFVRCGREFFEDECLKFYYTIDECLTLQNTDTIFLGGVLQYLEHPYDFLDKIIRTSVSYIIFDRTPFIQGGFDRLTVQKVSPEIYPASYPARFFSHGRFKQFMSEQFDLVAEFNTNDLVNFDALFKGFIFKRR